MATSGERLVVWLVTNTFSSGIWDEQWNCEVHNKESLSIRNWSAKWFPQVPAYEQIQEVCEFARGKDIACCFNSKVDDWNQEALDIQSELIFVNGMVHLSQDWNFGTPLSLRQLQHCHPSQRLMKQLFHLYDVMRSIYLCIKSFHYVLCSLPRYGLIIRPWCMSIKACLTIHDW